MQKKTELNDMAKELVVIHKGLIDKLKETDNFAELLSLYIFYYYTAKWQETNQPKCSTYYTAQGLKWGVEKVRKYKRILKETGLVEDIVDIDEKTKQTKGWYIKINYIFKQNTINNIELSHPSGFPHSGSSQGVGKSDPNALSTLKLNALSINIKNIYTHWNSKNIISHNKLTPKIENKISSSLKAYSEKEICGAIDNYAEVLGCSYFFFTYKWSLYDFLGRGIDKFVDWDICENNFLDKKQSADYMEYKKIMKDIKEGR